MAGQVWKAGTPLQLELQPSTVKVETRPEIGEVKERRTDGALSTDVIACVYSDVSANGH